MTTIITLTPNFIYLYIVIFLVSLYFLITYTKTFSQEGLIDFFVYLTTKLILFMLTISFLLISCVILLGGDQTITDYFINNLTSNILIYCFFNYGLFGLILFIDWVWGLIKKNDLYSFSIIKDEGKIKK